MSEFITLGRTLKKRAADVLAYFDGPDHLRGSALGFRDLTHVVARSLLESGGFRPRLHPQL